MIFLFAFHWESEPGYTLGTRLGKWDRELLWGNFTSPFCCWRCQNYQQGLSGLCWEQWLLRSRTQLRVGMADPWAMFPPAARHEMLNHPTQSCRVPGLSLAQCQRVISVLFCIVHWGLSGSLVWKWDASGNPLHRDPGRGMQIALQLQHPALSFTVLRIHKQNSNRSKLS